MTGRRGGVFYISQPEASDVPVQETPAIAGSRGGESGDPSLD